MVRSRLKSLVRRLRPSEDSEDGEEEDDDSRFIPSLLDASVRYAHGGTSGAEGELAQIEEKANQLEEIQREE
jgi:hypothetical protein